MGKTLDSVIFGAFDVINKGMMEMDHFLDVPARTWYGEAAKHLAPMYTAHRMSNSGYFLGTLIGMAAESVKIWGYVNLIAEGVSSVAK